MSFIVRKRIPGGRWYLIGNFKTEDAARRKVRHPKDCRKELEVQLMNTETKEILLTSYPNALIDFFSVTVRR